MDGEYLREAADPPHCKQRRKYALIAVMAKDGRQGKVFKSELSEFPEINDRTQYKLELPRYPFLSITHHDRITDP